MACGHKKRFAVITSTSAVVRLQSDNGIERSGFSATFFTIKKNNKGNKLKKIKRKKV